MFGYSREAVRVKVKKCEGKLQPELRKFSVDPQITSLEVLQSILTKAFDIKSDFTISYKTADDFGNEIHLPLLSDWDLDAAFLKAHNISINQRCEPCVQLKVDMKPFAEASEDWEPSNIITNANINQNESIYSSNCSEADMKQPQSGFQGLFMTQVIDASLCRNNETVLMEESKYNKGKQKVEKTLSMVTRALNLYDDPTLPPRAPLNDAEFRTYLDPVGHIVHSSKLREVIYCGGIEPSLRKVVWKHILNVYPDGMTGKERMDYMKKKATEYYALRNSWKDSIQKGQVNNNLAYVTSMVRKDVLRTDRHHKFYAGSDDNQNIASLFNILTTYALNHPLVSYCQGMSDLASPLMVTMGDEAHAYICLCALMCRLHPNFLLNGEAMTLKFTHLAESLQAYDADFYAYLKSQQADDLLFCYRWLLLEMKREFAFEDSLRMLEVLWSSLPPKPPDSELSLKEQEFDPSMTTVEDGEPPPMSPLNKTPRENAYTKVCSIRRQSSTFSLVNITSNKMTTYKHMNHSLDENASRKGLNNISLKNAKGFQSLDDAALQISKQNPAKFDSLKKNIRDLNQGCNNKNLHKTLSINRNNSLKKKAEDRNTIMENGQHLKADDMKHFSSSTGSLPNGKVNPDSSQNTSPLGNQIRDLRQKITQSNNFFSSLDKLDYNSSSVEDYENSNKPKTKMIKNLNEFLNFTSCNKIGGNIKLQQDKLLRTQSVVENSNVCENPAITVTRTSFDENDLQTYQKVSRDCKNQTNSGEKIFDTEYNDGSSPDDSQEYYPMTTSMTRELRLELEHLDRQVFGADYTNRNNFPSDSVSDSISIEEKPTTAECDCVVSKKDLEVTDYSDTQIEIAEIVSTPKMRQVKDASNKIIVKSTDDIYLWENPLHKNCLNVKGPASYPQTPDEQAELEYDGDTGEIFEETSGKKSITPIRLLRKPQPVHIKDHEHVNKNSSESDISEIIVNEQPQLECESGTARPHNFFSSMSQELENARKNCETILVTKQSPNLHSIATTITNFQKKYDALKPQMKSHLSSSTNMVGPIACEEVAEVSGKWTVNSLPPPNVFGGGNPFLMFLCLTVLLQHRDFIMRNHMDYNELAMHFDKMVRKHNVNRVLNQARQMYAMYLKQQAANSNDINT